MSSAESATIPLVSRMADGKPFADGQGCAMLFKRAGAIDIAMIAHRNSESIAGTCELKLEVFVGGLFPRQIKAERESFPKVLHAIARLARLQQQVADFLVAAGEVAPSLRVTGVDRAKRFANPERLRVTFDCSG